MSIEVFQYLCTIWPKDRWKNGRYVMYVLKWKALDSSRDELGARLRNNKKEPKSMDFMTDLGKPFRIAAARRAFLLIPAAGLFILSASAWAQINACDLSNDGIVNNVDVNLAA